MQRPGGGAGGTLEAELARLAQQHRMQTKELDRLRIMVEVLTELLIQSGAIDRNVLAYRIEAAMSDLHESTELPLPPAQCPGCGVLVSAGALVRTARGDLCHGCAARG